MVPNPSFKGLGKVSQQLQAEEIQSFHSVSLDCIFMSSAGSIKPSTGYTLTNEG